MTLEERLESLAKFTDKMFRRHAEEFERHNQLIREVDQRITRRIDALSEATARRLDAPDHDLQCHEEALAKIDARLDRIAELVERFIQGQARNGH
jgi:tRNA isopentenyl-2-thiomethyl-A-37 hydroxylase MiaE